MRYGGAVTRVEAVVVMVVWAVFSWDVRGAAVSTDTDDRKNKSQQHNPVTGTGTVA